MDNNDIRNTEPCPGEGPRSPAKVINAAELVSWQWRPHTWLLWQMVPQGGVTLLAGETASGKSFLGLDLALGMASGRGRAWDMGLGSGNRDQGSGNSSCGRVLDPPNQYDSHLTRNGTPSPGQSRIPYEDPSQAQDDTQRAEWSVPIPYEARVRYFCSDADPNLIAERVLKLCRGYPTPTYGGTATKNRPGIDVPSALDLDFSQHQFSDPESFRWLQKEILRQGYQLLIFDGLAQYLPAMADGSAQTVGAFLRGVRQLASSVCQSKSCCA